MHVTTHENVLPPQAGAPVLPLTKSMIFKNNHVFFYFPSILSFFYLLPSALTTRHIHQRQS